MGRCWDNFIQGIFLLEFCEMFFGFLAFFLLMIPMGILVCATTLLLSPFFVYSYIKNGNYMFYDIDDSTFYYSFKYTTLFAFILYFYIFGCTLVVVLTVCLSPILVSIHIVKQEKLRETANRALYAAHYLAFKRTLLVCYYFYSPL